MTSLWKLTGTMISFYFFSIVLDWLWDESKMALIYHSYILTVVRFGHLRKKWVELEAYPNDYQWSNTDDRI